MSGGIKYEGALKAHRGAVTSLACPQTQDSAIKVVSTSRDKTAVSWVAAERYSEDQPFAVPQRRLEGHSAFVDDVALTNNAEYALTASWDKALRLWNLKTGAPLIKFLGHTRDVTTCAFSPDNRHILSGSRDNQLKIWNVKGECVFTLERDAHADWVNCVRFSPNQANPLIVSGGMDNVVKVWSLTEFRCLYTLRGHKGSISSVTVSPDGSLCASAGKDGTAKLWDLSRGEHLYELEAGEAINQISFSPNRYWLCAATDSAIRVWDLETKEVIAELKPQLPKDSKRKVAPVCKCIAWSADGSVLYSGYDDGAVRVWSVNDQ